MFGKAVLRPWWRRPGQPACHIASKSSTAARHWPRRSLRAVPGHPDHRQARPPGPQRSVPDVVGGERAGGVVFCDQPQVPPGPSGKFVIAIMAAASGPGPRWRKRRGGQARQPQTPTRHARVGLAGGCRKAAPGDRACGRGASLHRGSWHAASVRRVLAREVGMNVAR